MSQKDFQPEVPERYRDGAAESDHSWDNSSDKVMISGGRVLVVVALELKSRKAYW